MHISKLLGLAFALLAFGKPQNPPPTGPAPIPEGPGPEVPAGTEPATAALPVPPPPSSDPAPPASTSQGAPEVPKGPICECGYTYCASVLKSMQLTLLVLAIPWNTKQLTEAYCSTPNATCPNGKPDSNVDDAVYICLCGELDQKIGNDLDLLCGCDKCLNIGPDYRGRCETPCYPAGHK